MVRKSSGCEVADCDGAHINEGLCHYADGPHKAKGLCKRCYNKAHRIYSQRRMPAFHVLTPDAVREIRHLYATGNYSQTELARKFAVSGKSVCHVVNRKTWQNVE
ncbi:hypothetical protein A5741_25190 [Mycolicibacterium conceptionense]|nr:hypothetical protein A5639_27570 [Mycolicibacterium conceptionense]OMB81453.1 hypothetical protein A5741_25190 [Mycolicibacterium conceptionense]